MKTYKFLLYLFAITICMSCAVKKSDTDKNTLFYSALNLKGSVKSAYWYYTYVKDSVKSVENNSFTRRNQKNAVIYFNRDIGGTIYNEFDSLGRSKMYISRNKDWLDYTKQPLDYTNFSGYYEYDQQDWEEKIKMKIKKRPPYPIHNYYMLVSLNKIHKASKSNDSVDVFLHIYEYKFNNDGTIKEQENYTVYSNIESFNIQKEKHLYSKINFVYDEKGNLIRQDISAEEYGKNMPFHALDTESSFCDDLHLAYDYDDKDRVIKITFFGCDAIRATETFTYHLKKNYVTKLERYIPGYKRPRTQATDTMVLHYDEYGSVIQKNYVVPYSNYLTGLPEITYYRYEYDHYKNWNKCYVYMEGTPEEGNPSAIIERELEYYED